MSADPFALTPRQRQVLDALIAAIDSTGVTPSFQEIADEVGLGSKSGVARIMDALEQRGWIQRLPTFARDIRTALPWRTA
jgi:repressor LexA